MRIHKLKFNPTTKGLLNRKVESGHKYALFPKEEIYHLEVIIDSIDFVYSHKTAVLKTLLL